MGPDTGKIIAKAKSLGGVVIYFEQKDGNCAGWVSRWIRKTLMGKFDDKKKGIFDNKYFTFELLTAREGHIPTELGKFLVKYTETEKGSAKAASLMAKQDASKEKMMELYEKRLKEYEEFQKVLQELPGGEGATMKKEKETLEKEKKKLERSLASSLAEGSAWLKRYIMKPTKAGEQAPIACIKYTKDNGGFRKGEIGKNAEGLKKLHAHCDNKIAFIAMDGTCPTGHAVGMHRLNGLQGSTVFFDPNYGMFSFPKSEAFDPWVEFWYNTGSDYTESLDAFNAKVFQKAEMAGDRLASAFQQRGNTRQNRRGLDTRKF